MLDNYKIEINNPVAIVLMTIRAQFFSRKALIKTNIKVSYMIF